MAHSSSSVASIFSSASSVKSSFVDEASLSEALGFDVRADLDALVTLGFNHYGVVSPEMKLVGKGWEIQAAFKAVRNDLSEAFASVWDSETKKGTLRYPGKEGIVLTPQQAACLQGLLWGSKARNITGVFYKNYFTTEAQRLHREYLASKQDGYSSTPRKGGTHAKGKVTTSLGDKLQGVKAQA